jgi:hypothetical protein
LRSFCYNNSASYLGLTICRVRQLHMSSLRSIPRPIFELLRQVRQDMIKEGSIMANDVKIDITRTAAAVLQETRADSRLSAYVPRDKIPSVFMQPIMREMSL